MNLVLFLVSFLPCLRATSQKIVYVIRFFRQTPAVPSEAKSKIVLFPNLRALSANANPSIAAVIFEEIKVLYGCDRVISPELPRRASRLLYSQHSRSALAKNSNLRTVLRQSVPPRRARNDGSRILFCLIL